jgi:hypothetical protein
MDHQITLTLWADLHPVRLIRNSAGMGTAWLLPFMNTRLGSTSMTG